MTADIKEVGGDILVLPEQENFGVFFDLQCVSLCSQHRSAAITLMYMLRCTTFFWQ